VLAGARIDDVADTPENRGMINQISYLLSVEEA
jgi:ribosomal protein L30/L7E